MRFLAALLLLLLLLPSLAFGVEKASAPWWSGSHADFVLDTSLAMQESDTTVAIYIGDCMNLAAVVYGAGADSVTLTVQGSMRETTGFATIVPSSTTIANQALSTGAFIRTPLATVVNTASSLWMGTGFCRYVRLIIKNNCDATQSPTNNTVTGLTAAIVGPCVNER